MTAHVGRSVRPVLQALSSAALRCAQAPEVPYDPQSRFTRIPTTSPLFDYLRNAQNACGGPLARRGDRVGFRSNATQPQCCHWSWPEPAFLALSSLTPPSEEPEWTRVLAARDEGAEKVVDMWLKDAYMAPAMENPALAKRLRYVSYENAHYWLENPVLRRFPRPTTAKRLGEITVPTLVILGEHDVPRTLAIGTRAPGHQRSKERCDPKSRTYGQLGEPGRV